MPYESASYSSSGGNPLNGRTLMYFNISSIPANVTIDSAVFAMYADPANTTYTHNWSGGSNAFLLCRSTGYWAEDSVTFNNQPTYSTTGEANLPSCTTTTTDVLHTDVTQIVQYWVTHPAENYGFLYRLLAENGNYGRVTVFGSSDDPAASKRPKLTIYFQAAAFTPTIQNEDFNFTILSNPSPSPIISFSLPQTAQVNISIVDLSGKLISTIVNENENGGNHEIELNQFTADLPSGMYFVVLSSGNRKETRKLIVQ